MERARQKRERKAARRDGRSGCAANTKEPPPKIDPADCDHDAFPAISREMRAARVAIRLARQKREGKNVCIR